MTMQLDRILLIAQIALYYACVCIRFTDTITDTLMYVMLGLIGSSMLIKLIRTLREVGLKMLIEMQILFYTLYVFTGVQVAFYYQVIKYTMTPGNQTVAIAIILIYSINYSLFSNKKTISNIQFPFYCIGMIIDFSLNLWANMRAVDSFSQYQDSINSFEKSYMMLATAIMTAKSVLIMNKIQMVWERVREMRKQQQTQKRELQVKLSELNGTDRTQ